MFTPRQVALNMKAGAFVPVYLFYGEEDFLRDELQRILIESFLGEAAAYGYEKVDGGALALEEAFSRLEGANLFAPRRLLVIKDPPYLAPPRGKAAAAAAAAETAETGEAVETAETAGAAETPAATETAAAAAGTVAAAAGAAETSRKSTAPDAALEKLRQFIEAEKARPAPERVIVFQAAAVDKRKKIFKFLNKHGLVVECAPLKGDELAAWIRKRAARAGKKIEPAAVERLVLAGGGMWHLAGELDKFCAYLDEDEKVITVALVEKLFSGSSQVNVFALADALAEDDLPQALELLQRLLERREEPVKIFFMLVRHYRLLLMARSLLNEKIPASEHAAAMQVHPFAARTLARQAAAYDSDTLIDALLELQKIDRMIKTGALAPIQALEIALGRLHHIQTAGQRT